MTTSDRGATRLQKNPGPGAYGAAGSARRPVLRPPGPHGAPRLQATWTTVTSPIPPPNAGWGGDPYTRDKTTDEGKKPKESGLREHGGISGGGLRPGERDGKLDSRSGELQDPRSEERGNKTLRASYHPSSSSPSEESLNLRADRRWGVDRTAGRRGDEWGGKGGWRTEGGRRGREAVEEAVGQAALLRLHGPHGRVPARVPQQHHLWEGGGAGVSGPGAGDGVA